MNEQWIRLVEAAIAQGGDAALKIIFVMQLVGLVKILLCAVALPAVIMRGALQLVKEIKK
jgi:hypothetical protein